MNIEQHLQQRGVNPTAMRILVFRALSEAPRPQSLRDLEDRLVTAERSTIFRALTLLLEKHLIHAIEDGSGALKYEVCRGEGHCSLADQHPHFYCEHCHRTFCLHDVSLPVVPLDDAFHIHSINYVIKGICPKCQSTTPSNSPQGGEVW